MIIDSAALLIGGALLGGMLHSHTWRCRERVGPRARDELTVAIDETRSALQELRETWDIGMRRTLAQLDQVHRLTEQVAQRVADYQCRLRRSDRR